MVPHKKPKLSYETTIQDLPDEMLEQILLPLNVADRKSALRVCRRWSSLKPFEWSSVKLVVDFVQNVVRERRDPRTLLACSRPYKHMVISFAYEPEPLLEIVNHFCKTVESLNLVDLLVLRMDEMEATKGNLNFPVMQNLEELYLDSDLLNFVPNLKDIVPKLNRVHMRVITRRCIESLLFLVHFSSQLVELEVYFLMEDFFVTLCETQFPQLRKLAFNCCLDDNVENFELMEAFFQDHPGLEEVQLNWGLGDQIIHGLCWSCVHLQVLCVNMECYMSDTFGSICELKQLRHLRIERGDVYVPTDGFTPVPSLRSLTMCETYINGHRKFNRFVRAAFPNLGIMELLELRRKNRGVPFKYHCRIYTKLHCLKRLVISESTATIKVNHLLNFCTTNAPQELHFRCGNLIDPSPKNDTLRLIPVQKLALDAEITPTVLQKMIASMSELRRLELAAREDERCTPEVIRSLRERYPRCYAEVKPHVQIEHPPGRSWRH